MNEHQPHSQPEKDESLVTEAPETTRATNVDLLVQWLEKQDEHRLNVEELYRSGPTVLGMPEAEIREAVTDALSQHRVALRGLTSWIQLRRQLSAS